jgi:hypothetical protein
MGIEFELDMDDVDIYGLEVENIDTGDYPHFVDSYVSGGYKKDGTPLTDEELDYINEWHREIVEMLTYDHLRG